MVCVKDLTPAIRSRTCEIHAIGGLTGSILYHQGGVGLRGASLRFVFHRGVAAGFLIGGPLWSGFHKRCANSANILGESEVQYTQPPIMILAFA